MRFRIATLVVLFAVIATILTAIVWHRNYFQPHRMGVSSSIANRMIWKGYKLPEAATDVTYYADFGGCEAEFAISESEFLKWCKQGGWTPQEILKPIPYFEPVL